MSSTTKVTSSWALRKFFLIQIANFGSEHRIPHCKQQFLYYKLPESDNPSWVDIDFRNLKRFLISLSFSSFPFFNVSEKGFLIVVPSISPGFFGILMIRINEKNEFSSHSMFSRLWDSLYASLALCHFLSFCVVSVNKNSTFSREWLFLRQTCKENDKETFKLHKTRKKRKLKFFFFFF